MPLLPLSLYIHWPFCLSKCPYCDFNSHVREQVEQLAWRAALRKELGYFAARTPDRELVSIFFGGGTPSLMEAGTVAALIDDASKHWRMAEKIEITLEANPTSVEASRLKEFQGAGVNRISMGIQALNDSDLAFLGRKHSVKEALAAFAYAQELFSRTSFDLIYARPQQSVAAWEKELHEALAYAGNHLSLYQLTIEPGTAFYYAYQRGEFALPEENVAAEMFEVTQQIMLEAGLPAYEVSNHASAEHECRHNLAYWRYDDYVGIGPGAHGRFVEGGIRYAVCTHKSPERWLEQVEKAGHGTAEKTAITPEEAAEELLLMGLRLKEGVKLATLEEKTGIQRSSVLSPAAIGELTANGLLEYDAVHIRATPRGMLVLNQVIERLVR